jgi:hypothetical protein
MVFQYTNNTGEMTRVEMVTKIDGKEAGGERERASLPSQH